MIYVVFYYLFDDISTFFAGKKIALFENNSVFRQFSGKHIALDRVKKKF